MDRDKKFKLVSKYKPTGDQPEAIDALVKGLQEQDKFQTLLGVTGSGKTYTIANVVEKINKPTLVLAHNKTLAAQLCTEFKEFFPENAVEYFVSYYDYYQPEAYIANSDVYIEKDAVTNDEIDKMRHSATASLLERRDVLVVASVSCIYGLGDPEDYTNLIISLRPGMEKDRDELIKKLVEIQYERNEMVLERNHFRVRGDVLEIYPSNYKDIAVKIEFFGDEIDKIYEINVLTGEVTAHLNYCVIFPASHYVTTKDKMQRALKAIEEEMEERVKYFNDNMKLIEAQRIEQRTNFDLEMMREIGMCKGIENYSRHISGRKPGSPPFTRWTFSRTIFCW